MRLNARILSVALVSALVFSVSGCAEDNEATAKNEAKKAGGSADAPKPSPPMRDQGEYKKATQGLGTTKANGYPGAK
jgi:hypothetical protein